jgi:hypothetical protein
VGNAIPKNATFELENFTKIEKTTQIYANSKNTMSMHDEVYGEGAKLLRAITGIVSS